MVSELNTDTLQEEIQNNDKVLVQYSAGWCGNCRIMKPKFKKMSSENENMHFFLSEMDQNVRHRIHIQSTPAYPNSQGTTKIRRRSSG